MLQQPKQKYGTVLMAVLVATFPISGYTAGVAQVDFAAGDVKALTSDGRSRPLVKGAEIASGEMIDTGSGRAQVRFTDGAQVSLAPQTQFRIDDYRFSGKADGSEKGFFSLLRGGLRTITGLVGRSNRENYRVTTTVATIGIRGTEFSVIYGNSINVTTGEGSNEVCNAAGCLILNSGETAYVADANTQPVMTDKKAEIPPPPAQEGQLPGFVAGDSDSAGNLGILPVVPLASGLGGLGALYVTTGGSVNGGLVGGALTFASSGELKQFSDSTYPLSGFSLGTPAEYGADGIIGWGRWTSGNSTDTYGIPTPLSSLSYVTSLNTTPVTVSSIARGYASFASTAPVVTSGGSVVATGTVNSVTGTMAVNFPSLTGGGSLTYTLNVPIPGQTFSINGSASQYSGTGFLGSSSTISSTGAGCASTCLGIVPYGNAIQGFFTGNSAERAGANYGFSSSIGAVTGAIVFK